MAMNSEDVKRAETMRQMRGPTNGQPTGIDRHRMDRDRLFTHEALAKALAGLSLPKVKA